MVHSKNAIFSILAIFTCVCYNDVWSFTTLKDTEPLFLSPYVKSGDFCTAKKLSLVKDLPNAPPILSYSGFFTVNEEYDSNIFFWFVPAMDGNVNAPIVLWMQGGPGLTSLFGFFVEHGPYFLKENMTVGLRQYAWTKRYHVIYVDNPVGAGFSFTNDSRGYARTEDQMAENMFEFLRQFFTIFPEYEENDFYLAGESYAGKYVPALSYKIHNERNHTNFNFKGMAIGNGLCDPETMMEYADFLLQLGLIDRKQAGIVRKRSKSIVKHIRNKQFYKALLETNQLVISFDVLPQGSFFTNVSGYSYLYNYLLTETPEEFKFYKKYLENHEVRKALHVGNLPFQNGSVAESNLLNDIMQSVKPQVQVIMDNYRVMFYSGQMDLIIPYTNTVNFLYSVQWKYRKEYQNADRKIWKLKGSDFIAGYVHDVKDFYEVLVRDAGHIVPRDLPKAAFELISRFLNRESFV